MGQSLPGSLPGSQKGLTDAVCMTIIALLLKNLSWGLHSQNNYYGCGLFRPSAKGKM